MQQVLVVGKQAIVHMNSHLTDWHLVSMSMERQVLVLAVSK
jgi:hypothetical protein